MCWCSSSCHLMQHWFRPNELMHDGILRFCRESSPIIEVSEDVFTVSWLPICQIWQVVSSTCLLDKVHHCCLYSTLLFIWKMAAEAQRWRIKKDDDFQIEREAKNKFMIILASQCRHDPFRSPLAQSKAIICSLISDLSPVKELSKSKIAAAQRPSTDKIV
jgi:hypothetical protein